MWLACALVGQFCLFSMSQTSNLHLLISNYYYFSSNALVSLYTSISPRFSPKPLSLESAPVLSYYHEAPRIEYSRALPFLSPGLTVIRNMPITYLIDASLPLLLHSQLKTRDIATIPSSLMFCSCYNVKINK